MMGYIQDKENLTTRGPYGGSPFIKVVFGRCDVFFSLKLTEKSLPFLSPIFVPLIHSGLKPAPN